jgi:glycerol kinase
VIRPEVLETTALGAAYLAGLAGGYWKEQATIARQWQADQNLNQPSKRSPKRNS